MRIRSLSQNQSKIPDQFRGQPLPELIRNLIVSIDSKHSLSYGEVEWLLESLEDDLRFTDRPESIPVNWDMVKSMVDTVVSWARETGKSLLRMTMGDAVVLAKSHFLGKTFQNVFSQRQWALQSLANASDVVKDGFVKLDRLIDGGLSSDEFGWIVRKGATGSQISSESLRGQIAKIVSWSRATGTNIHTMNDFGTALTLATEWADYDRKSKLSKRLSKRGVKTVALSGKWKAVWISPDTVAKPEQQPEGSYVVTESGGPTETYEYQIEQQITRVSTHNSEKLISIRDPNGVPQATLAIGEETTSGFEVYDLEGTTEGKAKVKELSAILKRRGERIQWSGEANEVSSIRELEEAVHDPNGFVPSLSIPRIGVVGGDKNSYKEALDWIYGEGESGSYYLFDHANRGAIALAEYADTRQELHLLEMAREEFEEWAQESWSETESNLVADGVITAHPDEDDEEFNPDGVFDAVAYQNAEDEYYASTGEYERNHEPTRLSGSLYDLIQSRRNTPENRAFYEAIDAQAAVEQEAANQKRQKEEQERLERERVKAENDRIKAEEEARIRHEEEMSNALDAAREKMMNPDAFMDLDLPEDDDDVFAFDIGWRKTGAKSGLV